MVAIIGLNTVFAKDGTEWIQFAARHQSHKAQSDCPISRENRHPKAVAVDITSTAPAFLTPLEAARRNEMARPELIHRRVDRNHPRSGASQCSSQRRENPTRDVAAQHTVSEAPLAYFLMHQALHRPATWRSDGTDENMAGGSVEWRRWQVAL